MQQGRAWWDCTSGTHCDAGTPQWKCICINFLFGFQHRDEFISGIHNCIPSPSNPRYVAKKSREATFRNIAGFVCNYPFRIWCNKGERDGIVRLVNYIDLWDDERVKSIWLDADESKGIPEELAKTLDVSLNNIDTYRSDGGRTFLLGQTT